MMIDKDLLYKAEKNRLAYWSEQMENATPGSEIEKLCRRMIDLHEARLKRMEAERDGAGR
nr:MAG TPA: hypothetical protein [Caudoviricetes sp.]